MFFVSPGEWTFHSNASFFFSFKVPSHSLVLIYFLFRIFIQLFLCSLLSLFVLLLPVWREPDDVYEEDEWRTAGQRKSVATPQRPRLVVAGGGASQPIALSSHGIAS